MEAVILAAGGGTRFGMSGPKALTTFANGQTILLRLVDQIRRSIRPNRIWIVVGFQCESIMRAHPDCAFVYNPDFAQENTAKSLLRCLRHIDDDVLMSNGDVVFRSGTLELLSRSDHSAMLVIETEVGDEEVKYRVDSQGFITEVSKTVSGGLGEAVGVNLIRRADLTTVRKALEQCERMDYFERGFELSIAHGLRFAAITAGSGDCLEIDFPNDLTRANASLREWGEV